MFYMTLLAIAVSFFVLAWLIWYCLSIDLAACVKPDTWRKK
jgi:hypothetical protein